MKIPKNVQFDLCSLRSMPMCKVFPRVIWIPLGWNNIESNLFTFNANLFERSSISEFTFLYKSSIHLDDEKTVVSSAKDITLECVKQFAMSFTYMRKSKGPNTDPRGTSHVISRVCDFTLLYRTYCFRSVREPHKIQVCVAGFCGVQCQTPWISQGIH